MLGDIGRGVTSCNGGVGNLPRFVGVDLYRMGVYAVRPGGSVLTLSTPLRSFSTGVVVQCWPAARPNPACSKGNPGNNLSKMITMEQCLQNPRLE